MTALSDIATIPTKPATCHHCGKGFDGLTLFGRLVQKCCSDECTAAMKAKLGLDSVGNPIKPKAATDPWLSICPPNYARFDFERLPPRGKACAVSVLAWSPEATSGAGIALVGPSDGGKSMLIHEVARRAFVSGWDVFCTLSTEFADCCADLDRRKAYRERCENAAILLMDDVGKAKLTERVETDLYHVLEIRERYERPILWTANSKGSDLRQNMTEDRADPIINRLRRSAEVFTV